MTQAIISEFHVNEVTSTNDYAKELLEQYPMVFVSAVHQTAGRGRNGKNWEGDSGSNIYCSIGIRHNTSPDIEDLACYMARASLATMTVLRKHAPQADLRMKYPNDIQWKSDGIWKKVSGALIEHEFRGSDCRSTVIGLGINVNQKVFPETIPQPCTSFLLEGIHIDLSQLQFELKQRLLIMLDSGWKDVFLDWKSELAIIGRRVRLVGDDDMWMVDDLLEDGRLVVRNERTTNERTVTDGDSLRYND